MPQDNDSIVRKPFDLQEAVVLLDDYLRGVEAGMSNWDIAEVASQHLRNLANEHGMKVDDSFRSPVGLQNRLRSIAHIYAGTESASAPATKVFQEAVSLYKNDRMKFDSLLSASNDLRRRSENKDMKIQPNHEQDFFSWLKNESSPQVYDEVQRLYPSINTMLMQKKALNQPLLLTTQPDQIETLIPKVKTYFGNKRMRNGATRVLSLYLSYLESLASNEEISEVDASVEPEENWIRFDFTNAKSFERTSPAFCSINGTVVEGRNWARILVAIIEQELANHNPKLDELYKKPLYANRADRPFLMKDGIEGLNCSKLSNGYWINVNWSIPRLMDILKAFCLYCGYDKEQVVLYGAPKGSKVIKRDKSPAKETGSQSIDMKAAEDYLKSAGLQGATVQELIDAVQPGAAVWPTKNALEENLSIMSMPGNRYVHMDSFIDMDEAEEVLGQILRTHFSQFGGYSNNQLLFGAASQELSMFLNDNDCENIDAVYAIARFLFEKKAVGGKPYKFYTPHIFETEPDYPMTLHGMMIHLARNNGGILQEESAKSYLQKTMLTYGGMGQLLKVGSANTFLIYDGDRYLLSEAIGIDKAWCIRMHDRIDDLFRKANVAYVIPRDISTAWLDTLPALPQNLSWTRLLLQQVLDKYPTIGFKSISADLSQSHRTLAAAFVPMDSPLQTFPDVVTLFMEERHNLPMRMPGENLRLELRDAGMLEANEMIYTLHKALDDYRFAWTDENKTVLVRGNK